MVNPGGGGQLRLDLVQFGDRRGQASGRMNDAEQQNERPQQHDQPLERIVEHAGAKAAESGIQRDADAENQQAGIIGHAGRGLQQACAADKLDRHGADKRHQQADAGQPDQQRAVIAGKQRIVKRYRVMAPGQDGELFAQHPQGQPYRRYLNHGQQYPAEAIFIGGARPADKRTGADVGGGEGHRQHETAHGAIA